MSFRYFDCITEMSDSSSVSNEKKKKMRKIGKKEKLMREREKEKMKWKKEKVKQKGVWGCKYYCTYYSLYLLY